MDLTFRGPEVASEQAAAAAHPLAATAPAPARPSGRGWQLAVVAVLVVGVFLRFATWSHLWLDEALTVNIARLPLRQLPAALRVDGAPPLYYVLLHGWMAVFGTSTFAVRALPALFSVVALPLAWLTARKVAGPRVAWAALLLLASGPFAVRYANEARMYSLVIDLVFVGFLATLSLLEGGGRRPAVVLAAVTALTLLTHYWAFYLLAVAFAALFLLARRGGEPTRSGARLGLVSMAAGCVLFLPWVPEFLYQLRHTGTPWGRPGQVRSLFDTVTHFAGGYWNAGIILGLLYFFLIAFAVFGWAVDGRRVLLDFRPRSPGGWLAAVTFATLAVALVAGWVGGSAFAVRYAAVLYPVFVILLAVGTDVFVSRRLHHGVLAAAVVLGLWGNVPNLIGERTTAAKVASAIDARAKPGDVVVYCPDQLGPSVSRELHAAGLINMTFPLAAAPERVNWVDYAKVNKAASAGAFARMALERAGPDHDVWVVWSPGYRTLGTKCQDVIGLLDLVRPDNQEVVKISTKYFEHPGLVEFSPGTAG